MYLVCLWSMCIYMVSWFLTVGALIVALVPFCNTLRLMNMGFDKAPTVCPLIGNCLRCWMLLLMVILCSSVSCQGGQVYLIRSSKEGEFVIPISCPPGFCGRRGVSSRPSEDERFSNQTWPLGLHSTFNAWWWRHTHRGHMACSN